MLGLLSDPKKVATIIVSKKNGESREDIPSDKLEHGEEMGVIGREILQAIEDKDANGIVAGVKALIEMCKMSDYEGE
jgi:hypothetical protein